MRVQKTKYYNWQNTSYNHTTFYWLIRLYFIFWWLIDLFGHFLKSSLFISGDSSSIQYHTDHKALFSTPRPVSHHAPLSANPDQKWQLVEYAVYRRVVLLSTITRSELRRMHRQFCQYIFRQDCHLVFWTCLSVCVRLLLVFSCNL
jgi:integrase